MNSNPIGVFDSGIGGLSVLRQIIKLLPNEKYIYYADTDNVPYGLKTKEQILEYVENAIDFLNSKKVKAIVVACNTATSVAIKDVRHDYNIPIIGIEPAIKPAIENRKNKKVLLMATPVTVKGEKIKDLIQKLEANDIVELIAMPKLVEFAERGEFNTERVKEYIRESLEKFNLEEYSYLVLGCTHFPYFKTTLKEILPDSICIIDGSIGVAERLKEVLEENKILGSNKLEITFYYSGRKVKEKIEIEKLRYLLQKI